MRDKNEGKYRGGDTCYHGLSRRLLRKVKSLLRVGPEKTVHSVALSHLFESQMI